VNTTCDVGELINPPSETLTSTPPEPGGLIAEQITAVQGTSEMRCPRSFTRGRPEDLPCRETRTCYCDPSTTGGRAGVGRNPYHHRYVTKMVCIGDPARDTADY
jgi:hypothetical protein